MSGVLADSVPDNVIYISDDKVSLLAVARQGPQGPPGEDGADGAPGSGTGFWGDINGVITDQTDLVSYVSAQNTDEIYVQPTQPVGATEGNLWYKSDTEDLFVYREISPGVLNWRPLIIGSTDSDTIDGGNY